MIRYEAPRPEDAEPLLLQAAIAFERYRSFAPRGWEPPDSLTPEMVERARASFADPDCFALMAVYGQDPVGHTVWVPAREGNDSSGELIEGLCHVRAVFVLEPWWGQGTATTLHSAGVQEMGRRGWAQARLFTPADHGRARRFYEREGWRLETDRHFEPRLGLDMVEYRRALG